jgi:hypothetical protein
MALLKIEIPTSGQLYRFAKTLIEGEELYLDFQYIRGWLNAIFKLLFLFIVIYVIYLLRLHIKNRYIKIKKWAALHEDFWNRCRSLEGVRTILIIGAVVFWFLSRFLFVIFIILLLIAWLKPEWVFKARQK